jgi:hypothetical protein
MCTSIVEYQLICKPDLSVFSINKALAFPWKVRVPVFIRPVFTSVPFEPGSQQFIWSDPWITVV